MADLLSKIDALLQGNPARFIGYGAAIVVWLVVAIANQLGVTRFGANLDLETALTLTAAAIAFIVGVVESIRKYVYSPATVARLTGADTAAPAPAAAVPSPSAPGQPL